MLFLPVKKAQYLSSAPLDEVITKLSANVEKRQFFKFDFFTTNPNRYEGEVSKKGISLRRIKGGKNPWAQMLIKGTFHPNANFTHINVTYYNWVTFLLVVFVEFLLGRIFILIFSSVQQQPWILLVFPLLMLLLYIIPMRLFEYEIATFETSLLDTIGAKIDNQIK